VAYGEPRLSHARSSTRCALGIDGTQVPALWRRRSARTERRTGDTFAARRILTTGSK
jgi:hypothetical protein